MSSESIQKGQLGEDRFRFWLDSQQIPFFAIDQKRDHISASLKQKFKSKRPDFVIFVPKIGLILVDVKYISTYKNGQNFLLKPSDIEQYNNLEKNFNYKVWFAISNDSLNNTWYWISVGEVLEKCRQREKWFFKGKFSRESIIVPVKACVPIGSGEPLEKLITKVVLK